MIEKSSIIYGLYKGLTIPLGDKLSFIEKAGKILIHSAAHGYIGKAAGKTFEAIQNLFAGNPYIEKITGPIVPKKLKSGITEGVMATGKILRNVNDESYSSMINTPRVGGYITSAAKSFNPWHPSKKYNAYQYNRNAYNIRPYRRYRYYRPYYKRRMWRRYYRRRKNYRNYYQTYSN